MAKFYSVVLMAILTSIATVSSANTIVVLGDSISAAYNMPEEKGWVHLIQQTMTDNGYPHTVINKSISGDTTAEIGRASCRERV